MINRLSGEAIPVYFPDTLRASETVSHVLCKIVSGDIGFDTAFSEADMIEGFAGSRTPMREAVVRLLDINLLRKTPQVGHFANRTAPSELEDLTLLAERADLTAVEVWQACGLEQEDVDALGEASETMARSGEMLDLNNPVSQDVFLQAESSLHLLISGRAGRSAGHKLLQTRDLKRRIFRVDTPFTDVRDVETLVRAGQKIADQLIGDQSDGSANELVTQYYDTVTHIELGWRERLARPLGTAGIHLAQEQLDEMIATQARAFDAQHRIER